MRFVVGLAGSVVGLGLGLLTPTHHVVSALTATSSQATSTMGSLASVRPSHVVIVIEENHSYSEIQENTRTPYLKSLFQQGASFSNYHAVEHPSFPNYLDLFSGSDQKHVSDSTDLTVSQPNLAVDLAQHHFTFGGYAADLPATDLKSSSNYPYAPNHVPWVFFSNVPKTDSIPFSRFPKDFNQLPTVSFVIPNLGDDMHTGSVPTGDTWLKANLSRYITWAKTHNSLFVITWDEDDHSESNQVPMIMVGAMVKPGTYNMPLNHFSLLRTIEDMYGLAPLGKSVTAKPITDVWIKGHQS